MISVFRHSAVSLILVPLLSVSPIWAQTPALAYSSIQESPASPEMQLRLLESDGPQVLLKSHSSKGFSVQVMDAAGNGISDAAVALRLPDSGPSGVFADGSHSAVVYTESSGVAHINGIEWNNTAGAVAIRVTATKANSHVGMLIERTLTASLSADPVQSAPAPATPSIVRPPVVEPPPAQTIAAAPQSVVPIQPSQPEERRAPVSSAALAPSQTASVPVREPGVPEMPSTVPHVSITSRSNKPTSRASSVSESSVSITSASPDEKIGGGSKKKWIILAAVVAAGAGAGIAMSMMGHSSTSSSASSSGISVGAPTVSIGAP